MHSLQHTGHCLTSMAPVQLPSLAVVPNQVPFLLGPSRIYTRCGHHLGEGRGRAKSEASGGRWEVGVAESLTWKLSAQPDLQ